MNNPNIEYYNENAEVFYTSTVDVDMSLWRNKFLSHVIEGGNILDAGCGSGRDSKAFLDKGFSVVAFDASVKMCEMASENIGQKVFNMTFEDVEFDEEFDGVWACASLLHVEQKHLPDALARLNKSLTDQGTFYASFKLGDGTTYKGGRSFSNFTEATIKPLLEDAGFVICESGITSDVRPGRENEKWINVIARKEIR